MLESLSAKLRESLQKIVKIGFVDREAVDELILDIQRALLAGDVDVKLVFDLSENIRKRAFEKLPPALSRREWVIKVVYEELTRILGEEKPTIELKAKKILLVGLFGCGKTSCAAKLARFYQKRGLKPALICCDVVRPAAYEQLKQLAERIDVLFYGEKGENSANILKNALRKVRADILIVDSSGRDALDKELIKEIKELDEIFQPDERILVIPADIGQAARLQSEEFQKNLGITDIIVTKLDATAKGGGALSACYATNAKVKFICTGETPEDIEIYDPKRFVARLIGLPDLETILEKAKSAIKEEEAKKIIKAEFDLEDFYKQIEASQQVGPLTQIADMLGLGSKVPKDLLAKQQEKMKKWKYMLQSMTKEEKANPDIINSSRIRRIAKGSGTTEAEVRELLSQYNKMKKMIKMISPEKLRRGDLAKLVKGFRF